jgi:hypothetical protein
MIKILHPPLMIGMTVHQVYASGGEKRRGGREGEEGEEMGGKG